MKARILICSFLLLFSNSVFANLTAIEPVFMYTKFKEVYFRVGPGKTYPIKWIINYAGEPLRVSHHIDNWYRCIDFNGDEGWVHSSNISKRKPNAIVATLAQAKYALLYVRADLNSRKLLKLQNGLRVPLKKCEKKWCQIVVNETAGWVQKTLLWGAN